VLIEIFMRPNHGLQRKLAFHPAPPVHCNRPAQSFIEQKLFGDLG
jgi:hypothetical protein